MKSLNEKNRVGDFCKYGNVSQGKVYKRSDGTCSCTALACVSGYHVSGGTCVADVADAQGNCVRRSYPETSENNTTAKCTEFCKAKAKANNCKHVGVIMKHSTKECICNPSNINKSCAKQEYPLPSNGTSCTALCNQKNTALECMPNGKTLKKTKADGSQWCVCNATDDDITLKYYSVCDADKGKTGKKEYCVSDAFNWTNVQLMQATALAQEYARVKHGTEIKCNNEFRQNWNDDYLSCTALNGSAYYEFKFDDLKETIDHDIYANVNKAICNGIYNGKLVVDNTGPNGTFETICYPLAQATCTGNFATTATKLGRKTNWNAFHKGCTLNDIENSGNTSIKKVPDIDSFIFYNGIQIQANSTIEASLREYVRGVMGSQLRTFSCVQNPRQMSKIDGHTVKGTTDDVLRCTINGNQEVDFVFDDMSEWSDTEHEGGMQNIDCKVMGGEYNGRECMYLGETQCKKLQAINVSKCPTCQQIYWDVKDKVCRLPSAEAAKDMENNIEIATLVAAAAGGVIVTVATGGTAAPALAMLAVETVGAGMEIYATAKIHDAGDKFLAESRKCQNASCAEQMLKTNLQRMANLANDLPDAQVNGIDAELARLAGLLESDSDFYKRLIDSGTSTSANQKGFFDADSWEPEQVWRAVGGILQLASIIKSIGGWAAKKLTRTTTALRHGASKAVAHVDDAARTAGHADDAADAARHATGTGPKNTGPTGGASHADDATNTGRHTGGGNTNGHGDTSGGTGRGGNTSDRASNRPGSTTGGGSTSELHPDLQNFNKRKLSLKYHPDKSAKLSPSMQEKSKQIFQKIQNWDTLSPEEQQALSKLMREFDAELPLETLRANVGQVDAVLDNMQQHLNTQRRTATMTETENLIKSLREDVQAARQAGASADEIQQAEDAIRKMEQALDNARNGGTSAGHTATKSGAKMGRNANVVELNENELVRVAGNEGKAINQTYVQASKDARKYMTESIESGKYVRSTDDYIDTMNNMHRISANGADGDLNWYSQAAWT